MTFCSFTPGYLNFKVYTFNFCSHEFISFKHFLLFLVMTEVYRADSYSNRMSR